MTLKNRYRPTAAVATAVAMICILSMVALAADGIFAGKWKGQPKASATPPAAPGAGAGRPGGFGGGGGGGGRPGGFGGGGGAGQQVTLNLKHNPKDNKLGGNIVFGDTDAFDVKDGKVEGNTFTFKAGRAPQPIYIYKGELKEDEIILVRTQEDGKGRPQEYSLKKK